MKNKKSKNKLKNTCKLWKMLLSLHPVWSVLSCLVEMNSNGFINQ